VQSGAAVGSPLTITAIRHAREREESGATASFEEISVNRRLRESAAKGDWVTAWGTQYVVTTVRQPTLTECSTCHFFSARDQSENNTRRVGDALQSCPDLVTAIGGDADNIRAFMEGLADDNNLRLAILQMPPGSILVAWNGTTPRRLTGGALHFAHRFSITCARRN